MQVKASKQSFNLNTKLFHSLYVNSNKSAGSSKHLLDDDEMSDMLRDSCDNSYEESNTVTPITVPVYDNKLKDSDEEVDETDECDNDSINDEINNLKFT
jgi:hypothetical protein